VDIDPQAIEITMMSLYLKALEGERSQLPPKQSLLPELKYNIICGNSLIGPDIYKDVQLGFFGDEERDRINAFDWFSVAQGPPSGPAAIRSGAGTGAPLQSGVALEKPQGWKASLALQRRRQGPAREDGDAG
jgi:hypothetical protein